MKSILIFLLVILISCHKTEEIYNHSEISDMDRESDRINDMDVKERLFYELKYNPVYEKSKFTNKVFYENITKGEFFLNKEIPLELLELAYQKGFSWNEYISVEIDFFPSYKIHNKKNRNKFDLTHRSSIFLLTCGLSKIEIIDKILNFQKDLELFDKNNGWNCLQYSAYFNNFDVLKYFIENKNYNTSILTKNNESLIMLLLKNFKITDVKAECVGKKCSELEINNMIKDAYYSQWHYYKLTMTYLLKKGVDLNLINSDNKTVLDIIIYKFSKKSFVYEELVKLGAKQGCEMRNEKCE